MRRLRISLTFAPLLIIALALSGSASERRLPRILPLEIAKARPGFAVSDRVLFVVDVSGSMHGELDRAVGAVLLILMSPADGFQAGIVTFADAPQRWEGVAEPCTHPKGIAHTRRCVRHGWAAFPMAHREAVTHLLGLEADGGTEPGPALLQALRDPTPSLTVVLVSDGDFKLEAVVPVIQAGQAWRKQKGLGEAPIMVWGAGIADKDTESLKTIAKLGGGGYWIASEERSGPW